MRMGGIAVVEVVDGGGMVVGMVVGILSVNCVQS